MECKSYKDVNYKSDLFCRTCGMDVGFEPIIKRSRLYWCKECEKNERR